MIRADWQHRREYIRTRSQRRPGDTDIEPDWADEALNDENVAWIDPDRKSKSTNSIRAIGYSPTAGIIITVILVPKEDESGWWGASAWRSNSTDARLYRKGKS